MRLSSMVKPKARLLYNNSLVGYRIEYLGEIFDIDNEHFDWFMYDCYRETELIDGSFPVYELVSKKGLLVVENDPKEYPELSYNELGKLTRLFTGKTDYELRKIYVEYNNKYFGGRLSRQIEISWSGRLTRAGGTHSQIHLVSKSYLSDELFHRIKMSKKYLLDKQGNKLELFHGVLLHEMVHAEFPKDGHGKLFMSGIKRLKDEFGIDVPLGIYEDDVSDDSFKQILECKLCGKRYRMHRVIKNLERSRCNVKSCGGHIKDVTDYYEEGY